MPRDLSANLSTSLSLLTQLADHSGDALLAFTSAQTLTSTGYLNNLNSGQIDLGGPNPVSAAGRRLAVAASGCSPARQEPGAR